MELPISSETTALIQDLLERTHDAFRRGCERPRSTAYTLPGRLFAEQLKAEVSRRLSQKEAALVESGWGRQYQGLMAARRNDIESSRREFESLRFSLTDGSYSTEGILLIQVLLDPAEAYLHYKLNDYARARELVFSGIQINHRLTNEFGYAIISAQRMQLCHNLLRMTTREGCPQETVRLAAAYLDYLEHNAGLPNQIAWAFVLRDKVPDSILQYYFDQIAGEAALALAGNYEAKDFSALIHHADGLTCRRNFASHAHAWIKVRHSWLTQGIEAYLDQACELLELGRTAELSLWFAVAYEVADMCRHLGQPGPQLAESICKEVCRIPEAPWLFRTLDPLPAQDAGCSVQPAASGAVSPVRIG